MGEHDENISFERTVELVGEPTSPRRCGLRSLEIFARASAIAEARGVILADTKFEFGADPPHGRAHARRRGAHERLEPVLGCALCRHRRAHGSFDKQIVRDWLAANWDRHGTPPRLPAEIVEQTAARYRELIQRLTA